MTVSGKLKGEALVGGLMGNPMGSTVFAPVKVALRNSAVRRVLTAYFGSVVLEWALWCGILIYAYEHSGKTVAGLASIALFVPGALVAPLAGAAADGPRPNRVLALVYTAQAASLGVATLAAFLDGPLLTVVVPAGLALALITYIRPCFAVVVPGLVTTTGELTATNLLVGYCENSSILIGPLLASALIAANGPTLVVAASALLATVGALVTMPLVRLDPDTDSAPAPSEHSSRIGALRDGMRALGERKGALQLMMVIAGPSLLIGALDLITVVLAFELFDLGSSGPGILVAVFGAGALLGGASTTALVARKRLAPLLLVALLVMSACCALLGGVATLTMALIVLPAAGLSRAILDVTGRMLMQRVAPQQALASIFAVQESLALIGCAFGSIVAQVVIAIAGVRAALFVIGGLLAILLLATSRQLTAVDASADAPVVAIRLLRRIQLFAPLPGPALEGVARAAQAVHLLRGQTIVREGEPGDSYFAIVSGEVAVIKEGAAIRTMASGQGFGEIALLADVPRTATVAAATDVELLEIERAPFLTAVTGHDASRQAAWAVARNWNPEIDGDIVTIPGQR
ncbi:hypothetical protein BH10ACT2_BH10ACT2_19040 [soil metagenome]